MKHLSLLILSLVALGIFIGCRHKESPGSPGASSRPASHEASQAASPGAPQVAETASARIDSAGGSVRLSDGTRAEFPPGALDKPGEVTLRRLKGSPRGQVESGCVWLDCTAPAAQFAKDVAIRVPLPVKATAGDANKILAGTIDPNDGCLLMRPVTIESSGGRSEAVLLTRHFCFVYIDWSWLEKPPPASAGPLDIPIYKQGDTPFCWATCMQMLARSYSPSNGTTYNIIGKVGLAYIGNLGLRHRPIIGSVLADRTGVEPERCYWECSAFTGGGIFLDGLERYLKIQLGNHKRPVVLNVSWLDHAYVLVGYDDKGNYIVHDPREVPGAGAVSTAAGMLEGYQRLTEKQLAINWAMPGNSYSTMVIPTDLPAERARVTLNLRHRKIYFVAPKEFYQFRWDYAEPEGYSFRKVALAYSTKDGPKVEKIPPEAQRLTGVVELFNCASADRDVTLHVDVLNRSSSKGDKFKFSMPPRAVTVGANLRQTVDFDIDLAVLRDPEVKDKQQCWFVARLEDGGTMCDQAEFFFTLDTLPPATKAFSNQIKTNIPGAGVEVAMAVSGEIGGPGDANQIQVKTTTTGTTILAPQFYDPTNVSVHVDYVVKEKYRIFSIYEIDKVNTNCRVDVTLLNPRLEVYPRRKDMQKTAAAGGKGVAASFSLPCKDGVFTGSLKVVLAFDQKLEVSRPIVRADGVVEKYVPYKTYTQELDLDAVTLVASPPKK